MHNSIQGQGVSFWHHTISIDLPGDTVGSRFSHGVNLIQSNILSGGHGPSGLSYLKFLASPLPVTALTTKDLLQISQQQFEMADQLDICIPVRAVIGTANELTKSLHETVSRFRDRSRDIQRLEAEVVALANVLDSLSQMANVETSMLASLQWLLRRWSEVCRRFKESMEDFYETSTTGPRDWKKMVFMGDGINAFIDTIADYRSVVLVSICIINMSVTTPCLIQTLLTFPHQTYYESLPKRSSRVRWNDQERDI